MKSHEFFYRITKVIGISLCSILVTACFPQLIRDDAHSKIKDGQYEVALTELQEGIKKYPESIVLNAANKSAREDIANRLIAEANLFKNQGKFDEADKVLQSGIDLNLNKDQFTGLRSDLAVEKRMRYKVAEVLNLVEAGKKEEALQKIDAGLHESPKHVELLTYKRKIESDLRIEAETKNKKNYSAIAENKKISLDFRGAPLVTVLDAVTRSSGINFILDKDVKQENRVTINLKSTGVNEALDLIIGANQLSKRVIDPQTLLIYPNNAEKQREHQEQVIKVFYLSNSDVKTTASLLKSMLRIKDAFVDERVNMIVLRESPEIIALAERLVNLHDLPEAEIMLEVEILEIKNSRLTELGINYPTTISINPAEKTGLFGLTTQYLRDWWRTGLVDVKAGSGLLINLKREVGDFNTLANPRIRAKSREKAKILIGDKVPVVTTSSNSAGVVSENISYLDVGIKLDVESVASPDDEVLIKLGLEVSTLAKEVRTTNGALAYQIGTRNANTVLRLRDGETQLLGGLISNEDRSSSNRVPGLGDLPVLGRLFSSQKDDYQRTELILAITPRILRNSPRPDVAQTEMWVGTEQATRLRLSPERAELNKSARLTETKPTQQVPMAAMPTGANPNNVLQVSNSNAGHPLPVPTLPGTQKSDASTTTSKTVESREIGSSLKGPKEVKVGDVFAVTLHVSTDTALVGMPLELGYTSDKVEILDISESGYFKQNAGSSHFTTSVNTASGRIGVGILKNDNVGISGEGEVLKIQMKAKVAGSIDLFLTSLKPLAAQGMVKVLDLAKIKIEAK